MIEERQAKGMVMIDRFDMRSYCIAMIILSVAVVAGVAGLEWLDGYMHPEVNKRTEQLRYEMEH